MSGWVLGTPLSSGSGRFMLPCLTRVKASLSSNLLLGPPLLRARLANASLGLLGCEPLQFVTSRDSMRRSSTCANKGQAHAVLKRCDVGTPLVQLEEIFEGFSLKLKW